MADGFRFDGNRWQIFWESGFLGKTSNNVRFGVLVGNTAISCICGSKNVLFSVGVVLKWVL